MFDQILEALKNHPWLWFCVLHATLGRSASVIYAIAASLNPWVYGPVAFLWDVVQVPLWWWLCDATAKGVLKFRLFASWMEQREERAEHRPIWRRFGALGDLGVLLLSGLPFWGCGMWTGTLLAWTLGMRFRRALWILSLGGLIGLIGLMLAGILVKSLLV